MGLRRATAAAGVLRPPVMRICAQSWHICNALHNACGDGGRDPCDLVFAQPIEHLPSMAFKRCVARRGGNRKLERSTCRDQYLCMAFARSLRNDRHPGDESSQLTADRYVKIQVDQPGSGQ